MNQWDELRAISKLSQQQFDFMVENCEFSADDQPEQPSVAEVSVKRKRVKSTQTESQLPEIDLSDVPF